MGWMVSWEEWGSGRTRGGTGHPFSKAGGKENSRAASQGPAGVVGGEAVLGLGSSFVTEKRGQVCVGQGGEKRGV